MNNKYIAKDGYLFDYAEPRTHIDQDEEGNEIEVIEHLGAKVLYLGVGDSIDNYKEVLENELY